MCASDGNVQATAASSSTPRGDRSTLSPFSPLSPRPSETEDQISISSIASSSRLCGIPIPDNWRYETERCIKSCALDSEARRDICRTLVTLLVMKHGAKPSKSHCQEVARRLILKYPFMADDIGSGYVSALIYVERCCGEFCC